MASSMAEVPAHLRRFVVEQDYAKYTAVDQAVWRFVLLQTHARLVHTAHPAYRDGLAAAGISVERIPSVAEMNDRLSRFGWGAVCVDGFVPPRAFQEFQARKLLPIAADMRSKAHLVYTPAPDIIHEAAGHAPILPDPTFAAYVAKMGDLGRKAFTTPDDDRVYRAVYRLSEAKEDPSLGEAELALAEAELETALANSGAPSEAARLSRLYWWTAEYGLVGSVSSYELYGAGLLSSLWESHACHDPSVKKLPLDERVMDVSYDITRPQPQLFVVRNFEELHAVADRAAETLSAALGGAVSLSRALASEELATVRGSSGLSVMGVLGAVGPRVEAPAWLEFRGPVGFRHLADTRLGDAPLARAADLVLPLGPLVGGQSLSEQRPARLNALRLRDSGRSRFTFERGVAVEGRVESLVRGDGERLREVLLSDVRLVRPDHAALLLPEYRLLGMDEVLGAHAGADDPSYYPHTEFPRTRVPRPRSYPGPELALHGLFERAEAASHSNAAGMVREFSRVHAALQRAFPEEWLLRWNLLETQIKAGIEDDLGARLTAELEELEVRLEGKEPILTGLRYLASVREARDRARVG
jgi:phenylalanine-4-hydroxylase